VLAGTVLTMDHRGVEGVINVEQVLFNSRTASLCESAA
jgi:hypothetical protein